MSPTPLPPQRPASDVIAPDPVRSARITAALCLVTAAVPAAFQFAGPASTRTVPSRYLWIFWVAVLAANLGILALGWSRRRAWIGMLDGVAYVVPPLCSIAAWRVAAVAAVWLFTWSIEDIGWQFRVVAAAVTVVQVIMAWRGAPQVRLYPDRLELRGPFGTTVAPWTALSPEPGLWTSAPPGQRPGQGAVMFPLVEPGQVRGRWLLSPWRGGTSSMLPVHHRGLGVPVEYLSDLIVTYAKQPALRARIGTRVEAERFTTEWLSAMAARGGTPAPA